MRRWMVLAVAFLVPSVVATVVAVAVNVATNGSSWWLRIVAGHPWWWVAGGTIAGAGAALLAQRIQRTSDLSAASTEFLALVQGQVGGYLREMRYPAPMPVCWRLVRDSRADHWDNVVGTLGRAPEADTGTADELLALWESLRPGRLVVLGAAGGGKTVLAARLCEALVTAARQDGARPLPVLIGIASWDPVTTPFPDWLADRLARDYAELDARDQQGRRIADVLVKHHRRILPVLDGFDELADHLRAAAITALNMDPGSPLVLTSRPEHYRDAVDGDADGLLKSAAVVELAPLAPEDVAAYLGRSSKHTTSEGRPVWEGVARALRTGGPVRDVLTNPLMAFLARVSYSGRGGQRPADLLRRADSTAGLEDDLLDRFVPAVYGEDSVRQSRWLTELARHLHASGSRELAWWRLERLVPDGAQILLVAGLITLTSVLGAAVSGFVTTHTLAGAASSALMGLGVGSLLGVGVGKATFRHRTGLLRYRLRLSAHQLRSGVVPVLIGLAVWSFGTSAQIPHITFIAVSMTTAGVLGSVFVVRDPEERAPNPERLLASSRTTALINVLLVVTGGALGSVVLGYSGVGIVAWGMPIVLLASTWGRWVFFVRVWLPLRGRLPWRIHAFLADACERGVLRRSGTIHHFRHARLQDRLAGADETSAAETLARAAEAIAGSLARSGDSTTLTRLARDLDCDLDSLRKLLECLAELDMANASRGDTREPLSFATLPEHARFTLELRQRGEAGSRAK